MQRVRKFGSIQQLEVFLNGGLILGGIRATSLADGLEISGLTLIFVQPNAVTVTFTPIGARTKLTFAEIKAQIETQTTNAVRVLAIDGQILLVEATPADGITVDKDGTANSVLGINTAADTVGTIYAAPPSATPPCWTFAYIDNSNSHVLITTES